ncbi:MAG: putative teichuronic acid biosynthesis glycosyl transferase [Firmicutes bacterium]|nr:putative teichuronic acid biosynthesis glycosyl transferase [Bacillota bacterium]
MVNYNNTLVSVITPAYNSAAYIIEAMESVISQTYLQWEMIIIDDCSTDNTVEVVRQYQNKNSKIRLIKLEVNQGVANARNVGIQNAFGRFIAFLDSDDVWHKEKLGYQIAFMSKKNIGFSFTAYRQFSGCVNNCGGLIKVPDIVDYTKLLHGNVIGCLTVVIDRQKVSFFYMRKEKHEDYIMWLSILKQGVKAYGLNEDLARYRLLNTSLSSNKKKSAVWTWYIYRNIEGLSFLKSMDCFLYYSFKGLKDTSKLVPNLLWKKIKNINC